MGQGEVWKKRRTGLAGALRDGRKTWLSCGDAAGGVEERKQHQWHARGRGGRRDREPEVG